MDQILNILLIFIRNFCIELYAVIGDFYISKSGCVIVQTKLKNYCQAQFQQAISVEIELS